MGLFFFSPPFKQSERRRSQAKAEQNSCTNMDVDIYGDLEFTDDGQLAPSSSELKEKVTDLEGTNQRLRQTIDKLTRQNDLLVKKTKILEKNISLVYATAVEESKRKDEEIARLRAMLPNHRGGSGIASSSSSSSSSLGSRGDRGYSGGSHQRPAGSHSQNPARRDDQRSSGDKDRHNDR
jgi:hypothetical protein